MGHYVVTLGQEASYQDGQQRALACPSRRAPYLECRDGLGVLARLVEVRAIIPAHQVALCVAKEIYGRDRRFRGALHPRALQAVPDAYLGSHGGGEQCRAPVRAAPAALNRCRGEVVTPLRPARGADGLADERRQQVLGTPRVLLQIASAFRYYPRRTTRARPPERRAGSRSVQ